MACDCVCSPVWPWYPVPWRAGFLDLASVAAVPPTTVVRTGVAAVVHEARRAREAGGPVVQAGTTDAPVSGLGPLDDGVATVGLFGAGPAAGWSGAQVEPPSGLQLGPLGFQPYSAELGPGPTGAGARTAGDTGR